MLENTISLNSSAFAGVDEKCCETGILIQLNNRPGLGMELMRQQNRSDSNTSKQCHGVGR